VKTVTVNEGEKVAKPDPDPVRDGYIFNGWLKEGATTAYDFNAPVTENFSLVAQWKTKTYTVTFMDGASELSKETVNHGATVGKPADPAREGYIFDGWFKEGTTTAYDFNAPVTEDLSLVAQWIKTYTVRFMDGASELSKATVNHGAAVSKPTPDPVKTNRLFAGWYKDEAFNNKYDFDTPVTGDFSLYAKWDKITGVEIGNAPAAKVYPNPTDGEFIVEFAVAGTYIITVTDLAGKALQRETVSDQIHRMNISSLVNGAYLLVFNDGENQTVTRIVKQ
jgi:uncharacterized repeat protein (TIGR02543 family)